jgi:hypothetical protein
LRCTVVLARGATNEEGEEVGPPGPRCFSIEASANIAAKAESVRASAIRRPPAARDCPSFYRPRRRQFTGAPHYFIYVWRYGDNAVE